MSFKFRKIYAKEPLFIETKEKHKDEHAYFRDYADYLTKVSGRAENNKSDKGRSYADYLMRLVIFYQEAYNEEINDLLTFTTLKKLEKVTQSAGFKEYNNGESRFPNAAFGDYVSCVNHLNTINEEKEDMFLNEDLENNVNEEYIDATTIVGAQKREEKVRSGNRLVYPRNKAESLKAKQQNNWKCELNSNHITFKSRNSNRPYIEAHHLIPMSSQDYFKNTIDFADNIVCLCPNCHRKIHHATNEEKKEAIKTLFEKREERYHIYGIVIDLKTLLRFYEVV